MRKARAKKRFAPARAKAPKPVKSKNRPKPARFAKARIPKALTRAKNKGALPKARPSARSKHAAKARPGVVGHPRQRRVLPQPRPALAPRHKIRAGTAYDTDLDRSAANYQPLTPLSFLERAARAHPDTTAIIHGNRRYSYAEFYARSRRLARAHCRARKQYRRAATPDGWVRRSLRAQRQWPGRSGKHRWSPLPCACSGRT